MNRYLTQGLLEDIRGGKRVGVLTSYRSESRDIFNAVLHALDGETDRAYRTNGREVVHHANGRGALHMLHADAGDGFRAGLDVLVVTDWHALTGAFRSSIEYAALSRELELVRF